MLVAFALLLAATLQLAVSADAESRTITRVSAARDALGIDYDRNGTATSTRYNMGDPTISVGESPADGDDARAFVPFWVTPDMLALAKDEGTATVSLKVWKAENLGSRKLVLEGYAASSVGQGDFNRPATALATITPVAGKLGIDVTPLVRAMTAKTYLVLRLRLDSMAPLDGTVARVTIGTSEAKVAANQPLLTVASKLTAQSEPPPASTPTTTPADPTPPVTTAPQPTPATPRWSAAAGTTVGASRYPVPAGALIVAPDGNDAAPGTEAAPMRTLTAAVAKAASGATIVLRAGSYHESVVIPSSKRLTVQPWPGEAAWLDGSSAVTGWAASGGRWHDDGWTTRFDASPTYTRGAADNTAANWGFVNPSYPLASHPDQIWIDGVAQRQVGSLAEVGPGAFFHDEAANQLWLGSDPTGHDVRASDLVRALMIRSDASVVRGLGIRRYAPSVPDMGAVTVERPGVLVENVAVTDTATTGLYTSAANVTLRNLYFARNGMLGFGGTASDNLIIERVVSENNNTEQFNQSPVSGGLKVTRSRGVVVRDSIFRANNGPGLWMDESVYNMTITGNEMRDNAGHGASLEISAKAVFANNIVTNNGRFGVKINNTSDVSVWNNTFAGNRDRSINIVEDTRRPTTATTAGRDKRQPFPDPTMTWLVGPVAVRDNIIADQRGGNCMLCVEDASHERTAAQIGVTADGNLYNRSSASSPTQLVVWSKGPGNPATFLTLAAFSAATGQDTHSQLIDGTGVVDPSGLLLGATTAVAQALPDAIASVTGLVAGAADLGASAR
ncbi:MAG TPA: right-handed parallel beta-helix repeat-containing protein [Acidimicrobiia bacterium]|jgi:parallel beta-helix repeat protein